MSGRSIASRVVPATSETHDALLAEQAVDERRLADVRPADDGEADHVLVVGRLLLLGREQLDDPASRSPEPRPCAADTAIGSPSRARGTRR
jgi:hypothetical protein